MATGKTIGELDSLISPDGSEYLVVETNGTNKKVLAEDVAALVDTTYTAGSNVQITDTVISATDTTYSVVTGSSNGLMGAADKSKLDGIAANATSNSADAYLLDRANHTGTQAVSTITGLGDAATKNTGTTAGTLTAGDDSRLAEIAQVDAESDAGSVVKGWTARRVWQSIAKWWTGIVVQSAGSDTAKVMSQKAVTDALNLRADSAKLRSFAYADTKNAMFSLFCRRNSTDTIDTTSITGLSGGSIKWLGGVLAPNGKIYLVPTNSSTVGIIDPVTNTIDTTSIAGLSDTSKWFGGVLAPNGKIYLVPQNSNIVGIIDPTTNTIDLTSITGLSGSGKWAGGVLAPNGKIYLVPRDSSTIGIIDPITNTIDLTSITGLSDSTKWCGGVLAPNGKIYLVPQNSNVVGIIDPTTNTIDTTSITGLSGSGKWYGGVLAPNGKIYLVPHNSSVIGIIDPVTNTIDTTSITGLSGGNKWCGGVLAPNGKIYLVPQSSNVVGIIDPTTNTIDTTSITGLSGSAKWYGGVLAPNGKIYLVPLDSSVVGIINAIGDIPPTQMHLSAYYNKF